MAPIIIFGAEYLYLFSILAALVAFYYMPAGDKKRLILVSLISLPIIFIFAKLSSHFYFNPRPLIQLIPHVPDNGFPSDHALLVASIAMLFSIKHAWHHKKTALLLWILAVLVAASRVLVGVHHTVDVIGSFAIAIIVVSGVVYIFKKYEKADSSLL